VLSLSALSATEGVSVVAHGIHYAIVGAGVVGLVALLAPGFRPAHTAPRDEHDARVLALRSALSGPDRAPEQLATANDPTLVARFREPVLTTAQRVLLPLAVVSSAAAAGVHAAVGPAHFRESTLFGLFFAISALLQLVWAGAVAVDCSRLLLTVGALGNVAVVALWAITRTMGLPFGLLPEPEAVGPWDVACAGWELIVAGSCIALLQSRGPLPTRLVEWRRWHSGMQWFVAASVLVLVGLSLSGAGA
jgi:hypothetical protein